MQLSMIEMLGNAVFFYLHVYIVLDMCSDLYPNFASPYIYPSAFKGKGKDRVLDLKFYAKNYPDKDNIFLTPTMHLMVAFFLYLGIVTTALVNAKHYLGRYLPIFPDIVKPAVYDTPSGPMTVDQMLVYRDYVNEIYDVIPAVFALTTLPIVFLMYGVLKRTVNGIMFDPNFEETGFETTLGDDDEPPSDDGEVVNPDVEQASSPAGGPSNVGNARSMTISEFSNNLHRARLKLYDAFKNND